MWADNIEEERGRAALRGDRRNGQRHGGTGRERRHVPREEDFPVEAWDHGPENVRCSLDLLKEGTVHFIGQCNEKGIVVPIFYMKLKFTEVNWLV